jgi:hypothetical protein
MYSLYQDLYVSLYSYSQDLFNHLYSFFRTSQSIQKTYILCIENVQLGYHYFFGLIDFQLHSNSAFIWMV